MEMLGLALLPLVTAGLAVKWLGRRWVQRRRGLSD
jgi:hypothetical protein